MPATPQKRLGEVQFDRDLNAHTGSCELDGREVGVTLASDGSVDLEALTRDAEEVLSDWPALHTELCRLAREEIIKSGRLGVDEVPALRRPDVVPFLFSVYADPDGEVSWSFGLSVPCVLDDKEYVDVSREVNGSWTTSEVCYTE